MWDEQEREKWVQPMPKDAISLADLDESLMEIYQSANMNPDKFYETLLIGTQVIISLSRLLVVWGYEPRKVCIGIDRLHRQSITFGSNAGSNGK